MEKEQKVKSAKNIPWKKREMMNVAAVFIVNAIVLAGIYLLVAFIKSKNIGTSFEAYIKDVYQLLYLALAIVLTVLITGVYFVFEDRTFIKNSVNAEMLFLIMEIALIISFFVGEYINPYLRPLALVAILVLVLVNRRDAIFVNAIFCLLMFFLDTLTGGESTITAFQRYSSLIIGFTSGTLAVFCMDKVYSRINILLRGFILVIPTLLCVALVTKDNITADNFIYGACSGPFAVIIFMIFLPIFESVFKKVSSFKLSELTDHKARLIRKLIEKAPGTFNHSIVVSNIAEACATAINENAIFARTCAYYHDVGKLRRPEFFRENQPDGVNFHDELTPELSANIIKSHTVDGYNLVRKNRLPDEIADVCLQHHGTLPIVYFYDKAKKFTDGEVDIAEYSYAGPKPQTKIAAIIMIADGCEAAARTLTDRTRENVKRVVENIINDRMELGQFNECEITLKELNIVMNTIVNSLTGIYHGRIEYPKVNLKGIKKAESDAKAKDEK